ncbi:PIG-L family deacetylase [Sulfuriroseicoccus oceanibius]|uniref:PIG-L family deacetylase n=1 Tax=Sulfuriroseicoccus oceanibius TaxID=2707525 RepID=A0A6B3L6D5_9BACT|nr:PIG-L family deacetylase [Sulfuriroseicoccus oceanibius]QQL46276.1 PIG-L family deacetylase [Sulfuriroseicoccus oceanibius]
MDQAQATGSNVTASINGGAGWSFDGSSGGSYNFGALDALDGKPVDGATVEFLFNFSDFSGSMAIGAVGGDSTAREMNVFKLEQWQNTGKFGITLPGEVDYSLQADSVFDQDLHVIFRRNDDEGTIDLFVNGAYVETHADKGDWRLDGGWGYIGSSSSSTQDVPTGRVYGVASYDAALSDQEIAALYNAYNGPAADPHAVVTPAALDFGDYDSVVGPLDLAVTIANYGATENLEISSVLVTGVDADHFSLSSYPSSVAPSGSVELMVRFNTSAAEGTVRATLQIETNGANRGSFEIPLTAFAFEPLPEKAALLVINPHPDDEGLFYGGTLAYYSQVRNLPTVMMSMTSGDSGISVSDPADRFLREDEMRNAARAYGVKYEPIFARFDDGGSSIETLETWTQFPNTGDDAADYLSPFTGNPVEYTARVIRKLRPEVLLTSDSGGDYGHLDHRHTSAAVVAAYAMAADSSVTILDDEGNPLPAWAVTKFYVHDADFDDANHLGHLFHNYWETPYDELGGATAREVTQQGLLAHQSQNIDYVTRTYYGQAYWGGQYEPGELWSMLESTVGLDTFNVGELSDDPDFDNFPDIHHGDFMENIDLSLFAGYLADTNRDGLVDGDDLTLMLGRLGQEVPIGSVASGDANSDGIVDQRDLDLLHAANPDTDNDKLPDVWELAHFSGVAAADPAADDDGDGVSVGDEYVAGLDPAVADRIEFSIGDAPRAVYFTVPAAGGTGYAGLTRRYQLLYSPDLVDWSTVVREGVADGALQSESIPEDQPHGFYKLDLIVE